VIGLKLVCGAARTYLAKAKRNLEAYVTSDDRQHTIALLPAAIAGALAAIGVAGMIFVFVSAEQTANGSIGMKSADAVYRAGATITPTSPKSAQPPRSIMVADEVRKDL